MARNRAFRRAQRARARNRATHIVDHVWRFSENRFSPGADRVAWRISLINQLTSTRKPCSCEGCGNQRRWYGNTRKERISLLDFHDSYRYVSEESEE